MILDDATRKYIDNLNGSELTEEQWRLVRERIRYLTQGYRIIEGVVLQVYDQPSYNVQTAIQLVHDRTKKTDESFLAALESLIKVG